MSRFNTNALLLSVMAAAAREAQWREERHRESVREWYTTGDGASPRWVERLTPDGEDLYRVNLGGKGHRYPQCIHGVSTWVDYDCACGACENGDTLRELAIGDAMRDYAEFERRTAAVNALKALGYGQDQHPDTLKPLTEWTWQPIAYWFDMVVSHLHERQTRMAAWRATFTDPEPMPPSFEDREAQAHYDDTWSN